MIAAKRCETSSWLAVVAWVATAGVWLAGMMPLALVLVAAGQRPFPYVVVGRPMAVVGVWQSLLAMGLLSALWQACPRSKRRWLATVAEAGTVLEMHLIDNMGNMGSILNVPTVSGRQNWTMRATARGRSAASLELVLCLKTREATLPVVLKDLEVPANTAPLPRGR